MTEERTAFIPSPKGRGVFCLLFYNQEVLVLIGPNDSLMELDIDSIEYVGD